MALQLYWMLRLRVSLLLLRLEILLPQELAFLWALPQVSCWEVSLQYLQVPLARG
ncbi:MAG: hypothetical protein BroJett011_79250 [Chloroflexota bacterium]|nr:MAG: hypothetical protein BroJett011_79250 [Chloroflexota bacterium]